MTWLDDMASAAFLAEVENPRRTISSRVELVDVLGNHAGDLAVDGATSDFRGEAAQRWAGSLDVSDPALVPTSQDSPLDPRARMLARLWWRLRKPDLVSWWEIPVGTMRTGDFSVGANRSGVQMTVPLVDVLAECSERGGYRGATVQLGGANVADALITLFGYLLPGVPITTGTTSVTLPTPYEVGGTDRRTPQQDWTDIAATAGWVVRTDRLGVIVCDATPEPAVTPIDWQEGPLCAVTDLDRALSWSTITNRVICSSSSPEVSPPVVGIVEDTDPGSSTYVGRMVWPTEITSDAVTTVEAATNMARATFERYRRPLETVKVSVPQRPDLGYRTPTRLARIQAGVAGDYAVSSWNLRMTPKPQTMAVTMMQRSIQ